MTFTIKSVASIDENVRGALVYYIIQLYFTYYVVYNVGISIKIPRK